MGEPALDLSEIMDLYRDDARRMVGQMQSALARWEEIQKGEAARQELRKLSHQMRGSGRTYGFRSATRLCKAIENLLMKLENRKFPADDRLRTSLRTKVERLASMFS
jgi:chemotaxis protein histidine kinase CheA